MRATTVNRKIEQLLLSLHTAAAGSPDYRTAVEELKTLITAPHLYRNETQFQLPEGMAKESIIVSDALESVTNGMYNPDILNRLQAIDTASPFYPWRNAVMAILAFYQSDRDNMLQLLERIPDATPPAALKPVLQNLCRIDTKKQLGAAAKRLVDDVREDRVFLLSAIEQLEEYLEAGIEEAFSETAMLLVQDLLSSYPQAARRLALWSMQTAAEQEFDLSFYLRRFKVLFGEVEGLRLTALALQSVEPDISLLFWLRYSIGHLASGLVDQPELAALLSLIADILSRFQNDGTYSQLVENEEYSKGLGLLVRKLYDEVRRHLPNLQQPLKRLFESPAPPTNTYGWLQLLIDLQLSDTEDGESDRTGNIKAAVEPGRSQDPAIQNNMPCQLELF
ncbi:MAG: hypothetical protein ACOC2P_00025 [Spirochaetota bacterium]